MLFGHAIYVDDTRFEFNDGQCVSLCIIVSVFNSAFPVPSGGNQFLYFGRCFLHIQNKYAKGLFEHVRIKLDALFLGPKYPTGRLFTVVRYRFHEEIELSILRISSGSVRNIKFKFEFTSITVFEVWFFTNRGNVS